MSLEGALAANRFGLGAKPGEIEAASANPKGWLTRQLQQDDSGQRFSELENGEALVADLMKRQQAQRAKDQEAVKAFLTQARQIFLKEMAARFRNGCETEQPFRERLVWFWSNHFAVSIAKPQSSLFVGSFEREAIRPHVTGNFADMLLAAEQHPAMQLYLDNAQSIGPDSAAGRVSGKGLNENLGREILELHTLGVEGGYTQADVIALARILTGWSINRGNRPIARVMNALASGVADGGFRFYPARHEPGGKTLLGKEYEQGYEGGVMALTDLAHHPATARHIARKLATHFIADDPPEESVKRIERVFFSSRGDLMKVSEALIEEPAAWRPLPGKVRTPVEYVTAALRIAAGERARMLDDKRIGPVIQSARAMGEMPFAAPSPKGWPDTASAWTGSDAVLERVEWANAAAEKLGTHSDPVMLAEQALGPLLKPETRTLIQRAASPAQGLALLFASPEFQRR
jgi:uncharacterized protein (DUF1800 family)